MPVDRATFAIELNVRPTIIKHSPRMTSAIENIKVLVKNPRPSTNPK